MLVLGIAGGIASGKSEVAKIFESLGATRLNADRIGHAVLAEPEIKRALCDRWGDKILDEHGDIARSAVAEIVFGDSTRSRTDLLYLESLTHPRIRLALEKQIDDLRGRKVAAAIVDAALIFETGWNRLCDYVLFVDVPIEMRRQRAERRGWSPDELPARERSQLSVDEKKALCDIVVDNTGSLEQTRQQVETFWRSIVK